MLAPARATLLTTLPSVYPAPLSSCGVSGQADEHSTPTPDLHQAHQPGFYALPDNYASDTH